MIGALISCPGRSWSPLGWMFALFRSSLLGGRCSAGSWNRFAVVLLGGCCPLGSICSLRRSRGCRQMYFAAAWFDGGLWNQHVEMPLMIFLAIPFGGGFAVVWSWVAEEPGASSWFLKCFCLLLISFAVAQAGVVVLDPACAGATVDFAFFLACVSVACGGDVGFSMELPVDFARLFGVSLGTC